MLWLAVSLFRVPRETMGLMLTRGLAQETYETIMENAETLDSAIVHARSYEYDFFAFKTLEVTVSRFAMRCMQRSGTLPPMCLLDTDGWQCSQCSHSRRRTR